MHRFQQHDTAEDSWTELKPLPKGRKGGLVWEWNDVVNFNRAVRPERGSVTQVVETTMASRIERVGSKQTASTELW